MATNKVGRRNKMKVFNMNQINKKELYESNIWADGCGPDSFDPSQESGLYLVGEKKGTPIVGLVGVSESGYLVFENQMLAEAFWEGK